MKLDKLQFDYDNELPDEDSDTCYGNKYCECPICYELKEIEENENTTI